jgi:hypothetical protein
VTAGIYKLTFGDKVYIGRSLDIEHRFNGHISDIKLGKSSRKLISAYAKYGVPTLSILEECTSLEMQKSLEKEYILKLDTLTNGLNTTPGGEDICYGELNANCKYTNEQLYEVLKMLAYSKEMTLSSISEATAVGINTIRDISAGTKHIWLSCEYPIEYQLFLDNKPFRHSRSLSNLTDKFRFKSKLETYPDLVSPTGEVISINGSLSAFAKEHSLQLGNLSRVINGIRNSHKGWKLHKGDIS